MYSQPLSSPLPLPWEGKNNHNDKPYERVILAIPGSRMLGHAQLAP